MSEDQPVGGVATARRHYDAWISGAEPDGLREAVETLWTTPRESIVDPGRSELAGLIGDALLRICVSQDRPEVLEHGIALLSREEQGLEPMLDFFGPIRIRSTLGLLLNERYYLERRLEDLQANLDSYPEPAKLLRAAPDVVPDRIRARFWWGYARALWDQADLTGRPDQMRRSVELYERALEAAAGEHAFSAQIRGNLVNARRALAAMSTGEAPDADLDTAIAELQRLLEGGAGSELTRSQWHQNLAIDLLRRARRPSRSVADRDADVRLGIESCRAGLALVPDRPKDQVHLRMTLADLELARGELDDTVVASIEETADLAHRYGHRSLAEGGRQWVAVLGQTQRWAQAAAVGRKAMDVVDLFVERQPHHDHKQVHLRDFIGLAADTAYSLLQTGQAAAGLAALERSRAVLWKVRYAAPRHLVRRLTERGHVELAQRYLAATIKVRDPDALDPALRAAETEVSTLMAEIRGALGDDAELDADAPATTDTPCIVHAALSDFGGFAFVRGSDGGGAEIRAVELGGVEDAHRVSARFRSRVVDPRNPSALRIRTVAATVDWVRDAVWRPLATQLSEEPSVTLVACGALSGLPIHAAAPAGSAPGPAVSYALSAAVLSGPADQPSGARGSRDVLVVADPQAVDAPLPGAQVEIDVIRGHYPDAVCPDPRSATPRALLDLLPEARLVHVACHGVSDPREPLRSALVVAEGRLLRMSDILSLQLRHDALVVLSACQTAVRGDYVPDEEMSLSAGFLAAGAAAVIASLWPVPDLATAALMSEFYREFTGGTRSDIALQKAQIALRDGHTADPTGRSEWREPYFWGGFIHQGAPVDGWH